MKKKRMLNLDEKVNETLSEGAKLNEMSKSSFVE
jgi:hypothetical protein